MLVIVSDLTVWLYGKHICFPLITWYSERGTT